jgi:hypothetical protein
MVDQKDTTDGVTPEMAAQIEFHLELIEEQAEEREFGQSPVVRAVGNIRELIYE